MDTAGLTTMGAVTRRIRDDYEAMSPQLRQAARFVLDHPEELAFNSVRAVAEHAGVTPSTMMRLARSLGFEGFEAMREPFRHWLRGKDETYSARARALRERGRSEGRDSLFHQAILADVTALEGTIAGTPAAAIDGFCQTLAEARRVYILGLRSAFSIAHYFHYAYRMMRGNAVLVAGLGGTLLDNLRGIGPGDVLLAVSIRPYTRETVQAVEYAVQRGVRVITITDSLVSPVARAASHVLAVRTESPSFFQSLVPALSVTQAVLAVLVARSDESVCNAIAESERQLAAFDAYWHGDSQREPT